MRRSMIDPGFMIELIIKGQRRSVDFSSSSFFLLPLQFTQRCISSVIPCLTCIASEFESDISPPLRRNQQSINNPLTNSQRSHSSTRTSR